jgi:Skp family chaperone for outer membrane proteins
LQKKIQDLITNMEKAFESKSKELQKSPWQEGGSCVHKRASYAF